MMGKKTLFPESQDTSFSQLLNDCSLHGPRVLWLDILYYGQHSEESCDPPFLVVSDWASWLFPCPAQQHLSFYVPTYLR